MSEIRGVGIDMCGIDRMEKLMENEAFLKRVFTPDELAYAEKRGKMASASLAAVWAAKEAVFKAMGTGICTSMKEVEIRHLESGQPVCVLSGKARQLGEGSMWISLTHENGMAAAVCVWTGPDVRQGSPAESVISGDGVAGSGDEV